MKKWPFALAALLAAVLAAFLLQEGRRGGTPGEYPAPVPAGQPEQGVPLPAEATAAPGPGRHVSRSGLESEPVLEMGGAKAACEGGTVRDMLAAQGRNWGQRADRGLDAVIEISEEAKFAPLLDEFVLCKAFLSRDPAVCAHSTASAAPRKYDPRLMCPLLIKEFEAAAYMAGKNGRLQACLWMMKETAEEYPGLGLDKVSPEDFCSAAAKGMDSLCASLPALDSSACRRIFPARESDCLGDKDCLEDLALHRGLLAGDPELCGPENREYCRMYLGKGPDCSVFAEKASRIYCPALEHARKNSLQALRERKAGEQRLKEEREQKDRVIAEINERIRREKSGK